MSVSIDRCILRHGVRVALRPFLFVPFTGAPKTQSSAVEDDADRFATREPSGQLRAALRDTYLQRGESIA
jgi:hypothetical protein